MYKNIFYFHLKNITIIIWMLLFSFIFLFLHLYTQSIEETMKNIINAIADGVILAIIISLFNMILKNFNHLSNIKKYKESIESVLIMSLLNLKYGTEHLPDISEVNLTELCDSLLKNIDKYDEKKFIEFKYSITNDYQSILQNISVSSKIDYIHSFIYSGIVSNLNALFQNWKETETNLEKFKLNHPINHKKNNFNLYIYSKDILKIYINTCKQFSLCEFDDYYLKIK